MQSSRYRGSSPNKRRKPRWRLVRTVASLGLIVAASGTFVYGVTLLPPSPMGAYPVPDFKVRDWEKKRSNSVRYQPNRSKIDALTHQGYSGALEFDQTAGAIKMDIRDKNGDHLKGAYVVARLSGPDQTNRSQHLMQQGRDAKYAAELGRMERGDWTVSVTAVNPEERKNSPFLFHIDKVINVN